MSEPTKVGREQFEAWLGSEVCEVHWDESAEKNAWYAWQAAYQAGRESMRSDEALVVEIARELYDRFVMGGWEPQDAYPQIREWLRALPLVPGKESE